MRFKKDEIDAIQGLYSDCNKKEKKYIEQFKKFAEPDGIHLAAEYIDEISKLRQEYSEARKLLNGQIIKMWESFK